MKRVLSGLTLASALAMGCESLPQLWEHPKPAPTATAAKPAAPPVVAPEQLNDANARQIAESLLEEMDRDAQGELPPAVDQPTKPSTENRR